GLGHRGTTPGCRAARRPPHPAPRAPDGGLPARPFGPPAAVVVGSLVVAVVFLVVLEFLVIISFVGQKLWRDPAMMHDLVFTLPLLIWVLIAVTVAEIGRAHV